MAAACRAGCDAIVIESAMQVEPGFFTGYGKGKAIIKGIKFLD